MKYFIMNSGLLQTALAGFFFVGFQLQALAEEWKKAPVEDVGDVAAGLHNSVLIVDASGALFHSRDGGQTFASFGRTGVSRVAVSPSGVIWIVDTDGKVWSSHGGRTWDETDASGMVDVAAASNGLVACTAADGGAIWLSPNGVTFTQDRGPSDFFRVSFDPANTLWATATDGSLWKRVRGDWSKTKGEKMADVAAGPQNILWLVDQSSKVWVSNWGDGFKLTNGNGFQNIAVSPEGIAWAAGANGTLWSVDANAKVPPAGPTNPAPPPTVPKIPLPPSKTGGPIFRLPPKAPTVPVPPPVLARLLKRDVEAKADGAVFHFDTDVAVAPVIIITKVRPRNAKVDPKDIVKTVSGNKETSHRIVVDGLPSRTSFYFVVTVNPGSPDGWIGSFTTTETDKI